MSTTETFLGPFMGTARCAAVFVCLCCTGWMSSLTTAHRGCHRLCDPGAEGLCFLGAGSACANVPARLGVMFCHPAPTGWVPRASPHGGSSCEGLGWPLSFRTLGAVPELCRGLLMADPIPGTVPCPAATACLAPELLPCHGFAGWALGLPQLPSLAWLSSCWPWS